MEVTVRKENRRRIGVFFSAMISACVFAMVMAWATSPEGEEPKYGGKKLSEWLTQYDNNSEAEAGSAEAKEAAEATEALRHIGTNGLPFVLKWMREGPPYQDVDGIFEVLGPKAAPAIPALAQLLNCADQQTVRRAIYPLADIGKESLPVLIAALGNPQNPDRPTIASAIRLMAIQKIDTTPAVPVLVHCLNDNNAVVVEYAADALIWAARQDPSPAIPAVIACLENPRTQVRDSAAEALGTFRGKARAAVPGLQKLLNDPDPHVRWQASNSLKKIDGK